jgi:hypothetical protein
MKNFLDSKILKSFLPVFVLLFAFSVRVYGINWDQNQHLHPDERFLTMTTDSMVWPDSFSQYLNSSLSKLNPYNVGASFYVYGTLPTTLVKYFSRFLIFDEFQYNNITLTGRFLSALFDAGVVYLVYLITSRIFNKKTALVSSILYATSVLPIQLSHFFAVDTFLNFFLVLTFYFLVKLLFEEKNYFGVFIGLSYGAALACKISAVYFLPIIALGLVFYFLKRRRFSTLFYCLLPSAVFSYFSFRILDPHVFLGDSFLPKINPQFIENVLQLKSFENPNIYYPPGVQWLKITPIIFPLKNIILWGLGLPLGIISITALLNQFFILIKSLYKKSEDFKNLPALLKIPKANRLSFFLIILWVIVLFVYQGTQHSPSMRYFLPIYPFLAIVSANFLVSYLFSKTKFSLLILLTLFIWPTSFLAIYSRPHSRVSASGWIYQNIPAGSTISCDLWDDCLPLALEDGWSPYQYKTLTMEPFAPDTPEKVKNFEKQLKQIDYLVLSSNRGFASIPKAPEKYPFMSKFYEDLLSGKLNFEKVAEITSYPTFPVLNIPIPDQSSEEAFTVYDHPKILIFKNTLKSFSE